MPRPGVLLDRDGVLVEDLGYAHRPDQVLLVAGAARAVARWNREGRAVAVVTNQSGIGRGLYARADYDAFTAEMVRRLAVEGARLDLILHCPHVEGDGCLCRKPRPGMLLRALAELKLDAGATVMIGDRESDLRAAEAAGVRGSLFAGGDLDEFARRAGI